MTRNVGEGRRASRAFHHRGHRTTETAAIPTLIMEGNATLQDRGDGRVGTKVERIGEADHPTVLAMAHGVAAHLGTTTEQGRWSFQYFLAMTLQGGCPGSNATSSSTGFVRMSEWS